MNPKCKACRDRKDNPPYADGFLIRHTRTQDVVAQGIRTMRIARVMLDAISRQYPGVEFMIQDAKPKDGTRPSRPRRRERHGCPLCATGYHTPEQCHRHDKKIDFRNVDNVVYVISRTTEEVYGLATGENQNEAIANAIILMSEFTPSMEVAKLQYRLSTRRPAAIKWSDRPITSMPFGKYAHTEFEQIPEDYLRRILEDTWIESYKPLKQAIEKYIGQLPIPTPCLENTAVPDGNWVSSFCVSTELQSTRSSQNQSRFDMNDVPFEATNQPFYETEGVD